MKILSIWHVVMFDSIELKLCLFEAEWKIIDFGFQETILLF